MDNGKKTKVVKFLKIMTAYFGLYFFHFVIFPHSPFYSDSIYDRVTRILMCLLFPLVDIIRFQRGVFAILSSSNTNYIYYRLFYYLYNSFYNKGNKRISTEKRGRKMEFINSSSIIIFI